MAVIFESCWSLGEIATDLISIEAIGQTAQFVIGTDPYAGIGTSIPSARLIRVLNRLVEAYGLPEQRST
ncbi:MAG: hypothetical protein ACYC3A_00420 [Halothiobacillus sp.]